MAITCDTLDEAIKQAERMSAVLNKPYCVVTHKGKYRAVQRVNHRYKHRVVWQNWQPIERYRVPVANTPMNKMIVERKSRVEAAKLLGILPRQLDTVRKKYGWKSPEKGVKVDINHLRKAMLTMTASDYAAVIGVFSSRIYKLCKQHNITRHVTRPRGSRKNGN
mgnify:FL=1